MPKFTQEAPSLSEGLDFSGLHPELAQWLSDATKGLCATARLNIGERIGTWYESLRKESESGGADGDETHANAMESLGCPDAAREEYERNHLTENEEKRLRQFVHPDASVRMVNLIVLVMTWLTSPLPLFLLLASMMVAVEFLPRLIYYRFGFQAMLRFIRGLISLVALGFMSWFLIGNLQNLSTNRVVVILLMGTLLFCVDYHFRRLQQKIERLGITDIPRNG